MKQQENEPSTLEPNRLSSPLTYDHANTWQPAEEGKPTLTRFQEETLLAAFPHGSRIEHVEFIGNRTGMPLKVTVQTGEGKPIPVLLRMSRFLNGVEVETKALPLLALCGLPVSEVYVGATYDPEMPEMGAFCVLGFLPGDNLQNLCFVPDVGVETASRLLLEAIDRLHRATSQISTHPASAFIPRRALLTELCQIVERGGAWMQQPVFQQAVRRLVPVLAKIETPLVFSNSDYNPANFLANGRQVTGLIDFELACFEDPHYGFAKFRVYDMYPFLQAGVVEQYFEQAGITEQEFAPRQAVRCLWTLQKEIAVFENNALPQSWSEVLERDMVSDNPQAEGDDYRNHVLKLLHQSLELLG